MNPLKIRYLLFLFFLLYFLSAYSLPSSFQTITTEKGLSSNRINSIFKDSRGFIWLGTQIGINRFDGNTVKQFINVGHDEVFAINETDSIYLWIGSENGLKRLNRVTNEVQEINLGLQRTIVKGIKTIGADTLILATDKGAFIIKKDNIERIIFDNGVSNSNQLTRITTCGENYWFASQAGICSFNMESGETQVYKLNQNNVDYNNYTSIECVDSVIYAGNYNRGIIRFDIKTKSFEVLPEFQDYYILDVKHYDGNLYVGTNGSGLKIYSLTDKTVRTIRHEVKDPHSINSNAVYSFLLDDDVYFIGTYKGGLNYNPSVKNYFQTFQTEKFNSLDYNVRSFHLCDNGDKLIGTRSGLIFVSGNEKTVLKFTQHDNSILTSDIILYIAPYKNNLFLIGTYGGGMYVFNSKTLQLSRFRDEDVFISGCIFRFEKDESNIWWIATDRGLFEYNEDESTLINYTINNSRLVNNNILYLNSDSKNRIWLGTSEGLCIFDKNSKFITNDLLVSYPELKVIINALEDSEGNIWVASQRAFAKVNASLSQVTPISFNQETIGVMSIIEDQQKNIWLASSQGIIQYNIITDKYRTYNTNDGILSYDFDNVVQSTSPQDIWWANGKGLLHCYLPNLQIMPQAKKPVLTGIEVLENTTKQQNITPEFTNKLTLSTDENNIRFKISLLNYSIPQADIYEYMMEGYDKTWKTQIGSNEVSYFRIPSGNYIFRVRSINDNSLESAINITIRRDWGKIIFPSIFLLLALLVIIILYRNRNALFLRFKEKFAKEKYAHSKIDQSEVKKITKQMDSYMVTEKPYLNPELKQSEVAKKLKISSSELSQILNQFLGVGFSDYVNKFRIDELVEKIKDKTSAKYTLTALAEQCGFSSRSSFFRAIKKHTGQTPAEFLKKINRKTKD